MSNISAGAVYGSEGVHIDVGERNLFYLVLEDTVQYTEIYRSQSCVVLCALSTTDIRTTIRVSWSVYKRVAQSRGYRGMEICRDIPCVPDLYSVDLHKIGSTFVEVSTREYVDGRPLSEV